MEGKLVVHLHTTGKTRSVSLRVARFDDIDQLTKLIHESARGLSTPHYSQEEIEGLIKYVFGVDSELIQDLTYFLIEHDGMYVACGGWSKRKTLFGGDSCASRENGFLDPKTDAAKLRAFFVHPNLARQGLATMLADKCETEARIAGFQRIELMSTLPGVTFYRARKYEGEEMIHYKLPNGLNVKLLPMKKTL